MEVLLKYFHQPRSLLKMKNLLYLNFKAGVMCEPKASSPALKLNFVELSIFKGMLLSLLSLFFRLFDSEGQILGQMFLSWIIPFPKTYLHEPKKKVFM